MFLSTLAIGEWSVREWVLNAVVGIHSMSPPKVVAVATEKRMKLKEFIQSLPTVPSHYCRASSTKEYLEPTIRSYANLNRNYLEWCKEQDCKPLGHLVLRNECDNLNLGLFQPKKDLCDICLGHDSGNVADNEYSEHLERKNAARAEKTADKEQAIASHSLHVDGEAKYYVLTMDLQSLLLSPSLNASCLYYRTKLSCHNFTMYNMATRDVLCYFWHECHADLSAHVFASCISDCISNLASAGDTVILYSDGCTYQNRNSTLSNALLHLSVKKNINVEQKYLEKGHTQMEVDSVHSVIERCLKNRSIYTPADYVDVMSHGRQNHPYEVKYLDHTFFRDFTTTSYYSSIRPGNKIGDPQVTHLKALKYTPNGIIWFKLSMTDDWKELPRRPKLGSASEKEPEPLFKEPRRIKQSKYKHLQEIKAVLPQDYHAFYDNLPYEAA